MQPVAFQADYSKLENTLFTRSRLRQLNCVLIGAGALGNEVARLLGLLGPARVVVVDPDVVEPTNLPRSQFFWEDDAIGRNKAKVLTDIAAKRFPETEWTAIGAEIADVGYGRISNAALFFSCVDSDLARLEIAYISSKLGIPVADAGLGRQNHSRGRVSYFPGTPEGACFGCILPRKRRRELLELWHATVYHCAPPNRFEEVLTSTPTMAAAIGAMQVELGLQALFHGKNGAGSQSHTLEVKLQPVPRMDEFTTPVNSGCPFHDRGRQVLRSLPRPDLTIDELIKTNEADCLMLDWPICTEAKCMACRTTWPPMLRLAAFRRRGVCPACASANILELQVIRAIELGSTWAGLDAATLGLPPDHLYTLQLQRPAL